MRSDVGMTAIDVEPQAVHYVVEDDITCPRCRAVLSARLKADVRKALSDE